VKGVVSSGIVNVYPITEQNGRWLVSTTALTAPVRTNTDGYYSVSVPSRFEGQQLLVEITADEATLMTCEVVQGCGDGAIVSFGEQFGVSGEFSISSVSRPLGLLIENQVHVTPFTHMARVRAENSIVGITQETVLQAISEVQGMLGLDPGSLDLLPIDITNNTELRVATFQQLELGLLSAAIQKAESNIGFTGVEDVIFSIEEQLSQHSSLVLIDNGLDAVVAIDDLMYDAQQALMDLSSYSSVLAPDLVSSLSQELQSAQQHAFSDAYDVMPVQITAHPVSVSLHEGDTYTLSVGALGGGQLAFRWYKDGVQLEGATGSYLAIDSATPGDSGTYTVRVSNSVGVVTSTPATVSVQSLPEFTRDIFLNWDIPLEREDGSPLALYEINSYQIAYGPSATQLDVSVTVTGASVTEYTFSSLAVGVYYFAIATIDSDGVRGRYSDVVKVVVN